MAQELPEGTVTIMFTDVEGSTALTSQRGDEPARAILRAQGELVRGQIKTHSGYEVKSMGDGFMVAFPSARAGINCAMEIQRALHAHNAACPPQDQVRVRIGLNTGEAIHEEGDLFGDAVNAAARIAAKAAGGQIFISEVARAVIGRSQDLTLVDRGRFRLKGFPERWRLFEVIWQEEHAAVAPALLERTTFVGREAERAELRRLLERAIAGHGGLVMLGGEPGVGKTRLAEELMADSRQLNMTALMGRSYEMKGAPPYIPFVEMVEAAARLFPTDTLRTALGDSAPEVAKLIPELRRMFPDTPPPPQMPPEQERRYLFNGMREFIARSGRAQPLLLVLDDLHWADDATLLLLQHVAQELHEMPVLVVGTYRDVEPDVARPLANTLEQLVRQRLAVRISLKRLPEEGVVAMLQALSGRQPPAALVHALFSETEGNPFFVEEVFKHLAEEGKLFDAIGRWHPDLKVSELDVPEGVRLVIGRRLERVSEQCRRVLTTAAVIGRGFTFELLEALREVDEDALLDSVDEVERAHLITSMEGGPEARFTFAHELIRQTLVSGLSLPRRQRLHLRVAEAMEHVYGQNTDLHAADLAHHLYQAGAAADPAKTARYLVLAGDRAIEGAAFAEALRNYELGFSLQPCDDRAARADLLYKRGLARRSLNRWDEALADWREAADAYERLGDVEALGRTYDSMAYQLLWGLRYREALELSQRGVALLGRRDSVHRARLLAYSGLTLSLAGYYAAGDTMLRRAAAMAEKLRDDALLGQALLAVGVHHVHYAECREAAEAGLNAADLLRQRGLLWYLAEALHWTSRALLFMGRLEGAETAWRELRPLVMRLGHTIYVGDEDEPPAVNLLRTGDIDGLEAHERRSLEHYRSRQLPGAISGELVSLGIISFWRGRWHEALASYEEAALREPPGVYSATARSFLLLAKAYMGDRDGTLAVLRQKGAGASLPSEGRSAASLPFRMVRAARNSGLGFRGLLGLIRESRSMRTRGLLPRRGRPNTMGSWSMLFSAVEALAVVGERAEAARLYPLVLEAMKTGTVFRWDARELQTLAGISAAAGQQWEKADEHFRTALLRAEELPHVLEQPEVRRWYARMFIDRNGPGDRDKAFRLLTEAIAMYKKIGMPKHVEMAEAMLQEV